MNLDALLGVVPASSGLRAAAEAVQAAKRAAVQAARAKETGPDLEAAKLEDAREHEQLIHEGKKPGKRRHTEATIAEQDRLDHEHQVALFALQRAERDFASVFDEHGPTLKTDYAKELTEVRELANKLSRRLNRAIALADLLDVGGEPIVWLPIKPAQVQNATVLVDTTDMAGNPIGSPYVSSLELAGMLCNLGLKEVTEDEPEEFRAVPSKGELDDYRERREAYTEDATIGRPDRMQGKF
jgi:hypothetical protein